MRFKCDSNLGQMENGIAMELYKGAIYSIPQMTIDMTLF
jgi:hypothetical protein